MGIDFLESYRRGERWIHRKLVMDNVFEKSVFAPYRCQLYMYRFWWELLIGNHLDELKIDHRSISYWWWAMNCILKFGFLSSIAFIRGPIRTEVEFWFYFSFIYSYHDHYKSAVYWNSVSSKNSKNLVPVYSTSMVGQWVSRRWDWAVFGFTLITKTWQSGLYHKPSVSGRADFNCVSWPSILEFLEIYSSHQFVKTWIIPWNAWTNSYNIIILSCSEHVG